MKKKRLEILSKTLTVLRVISLLILFVAPFFYGEDLLHYAKNFFSIDKSEEIGDFFAGFFTLSCFLFPLCAVTEADKLVHNELKNIENAKKNEHLSKIKACNLGIK